MQNIVKQNLAVRKIGRNNVLRKVGGVRHWIICPFVCLPICLDAILSVHIEKQSDSRNQNYAFHPGIEKNSVPILEFGTDAQKIIINALKYGKQLKDEKCAKVF